MKGSTFGELGLAVGWLQHSQIGMVTVPVYGQRRVSAPSRLACLPLPVVHTEKEVHYARKDCRLPLGKEDGDAVCQ